jgi:hypothetical protein
MKPPSRVDRATARQAIPARRRSAMEEIMRGSSTPRRLARGDLRACDLAGRCRYRNDDRGRGRALLIRRGARHGRGWDFDYTRRRAGLAVEVLGLHEQADEQAGTRQCPDQQAQPRRGVIRVVAKLESRFRDPARDTDARRNQAPLTSERRGGARASWISPPMPSRIRCVARWAFRPSTAMPRLARIQPKHAALVTTASFHGAGLGPARRRSYRLHRRRPWLSCREQREPGARPAHPRGGELAQEHEVVRTRR